MLRIGHVHPVLDRSADCVTSSMHVLGVEKTRFSCWEDGSIVTLLFWSVEHTGASENLRSSCPLGCHRSDVERCNMSQRALVPHEFLEDQMELWHLRP